ncbi:hypothetical protein [Neorhizobium sp. DT-125]|uniref:hypothetical protein n=1 Tax=Neorhizobium sp. DT-125 TaxID=3396163 RepID=UPI003F1AAB80
MKTEFARKNTRPNTVCFSYIRVDGIGVPRNSVRKPQPLAGLSLGTAIAKLTFGLAHVPELAASAPSPTIKVFQAIERDAITVDFELEDDHQFSTLQDILKAATPVLKPLPISPITAVDDPGFIPALKANINLPAM